MLNAGDVFVFPKALVHFQLNVGVGAAVGRTGRRSQNPRVQQVGLALFASNPPVNDMVLEKAFGLNQTDLQNIRNNF
jgi:hypothetical protein